MAFDRNYLYPVGGNSKRGVMPTLWMYMTTDAAATVDAAGYFDNGSTTNTGMRNQMMVGDVIIRLTVDSLTAPTSLTAPGFHVVNANSSGVIDVTDVTAFTVTDTR
jgi:hypothetical protein